MKEFAKTNTITYNLMTFTGFKSLIMFEYLLEAPRSMQDLVNFFENHEYIKEKLSTDTIRVYFTSLKRVGCEIARTRENKVSRYQIVSHPFRMKISKEHIKGISSIYKMISKTNNIDEVFCLDKFLRELADKINSPELIDSINSFSIFKNLNFELVENLIKCSNETRDIVIKYNSPTSGVKEIKLTATKVALTNNKLYLYGTSFEYGQETCYQVSRIKSIVDVSLNVSEKIKPQKTSVTYEISAQCEEPALSSDDKIIKIEKDKIVLETTTSNLFEMKRKILGYGPYCKVLAPEDFKKDIMMSLEKMYEGYADE